MGNGVIRFVAETSFGELREGAVVWDNVPDGLASLSLRDEDNVIVGFTSAPHRRFFAVNQEGALGTGLFVPS